MRSCSVSVTQVWEKKVKVIYLQRNPKDTWVSLYNHAKGTRSPIDYGGTWDQFFDLLISFGCESVSI